MTSNLTCVPYSWISILETSTQHCIFCHLGRFLKSTVHMYQCTYSVQSRLSLVDNFSFRLEVSQVWPAAELFCRLSCAQGDQIGLRKIAQI
jgi:hypothetical protein